MLICYLNNRVLGYEKFTIITFSNADGARVGWGGFKKFKPISTPRRDAGLKFYPIPALSPLQGGKNLRGAKRERGGLSETGQNCHP